MADRKTKEAFDSKVLMLTTHFIGEVLSAARSGYSETANRVEDDGTVFRVIENLQKKFPDSYIYAIPDICKHYGRGWKLIVSWETEADSREAYQ
jgi:hypothetical protein